MANLYFLGALPRSGSTLLCNILAQNPKIHTTPTSGVLDCLLGLRARYTDQPEFRAQNREEMTRRMLGGMQGFLNGFYEDKILQDINVIDKSRGWLAYIELIEEVLHSKIKIICPIRDLRDIGASFEKLYRKNPMNLMSQESNNFADWQTLQGRIEVWFKPNQVVGIALNRVRDVISKSLQDRCCFVRFEDLVASPKAIVDNIYDFLEQPKFEHDFNAVEQATTENDIEFGIPDLHKIKRKVEPPKDNWQTILPPELGKGIVDGYPWFYNTFYPTAQVQPVRTHIASPLNKK